MFVTVENIVRIYYRILAAQQHVPTTSSQPPPSAVAQPSSSGADFPSSSQPETTTTTRKSSRQLKKKGKGQDAADILGVQGDILMQKAMSKSVDEFHDAGAEPPSKKQKASAHTKKRITDIQCSYTEMQCS
jgi:hypothetical protein